MYVEGAVVFFYHIVKDKRQLADLEYMRLENGRAAIQQYIVIYKQHPFLIIIPFRYTIVYDKSFRLSIHFMLMRPRFAAERSSL